MGSQLQEITAVFNNEFRRFENADGDVIIGEVSLVNSSVPENGSPFIKVKGKADADELVPKLTYNFLGRWVKYTNPRTQISEQQFLFQTFVEAQPHGRAGVIAYLAEAGKGSGIGRQRAAKIWERFGSDCVRILREEPEVIAAAISGLSIEQAERVSECLRSKIKLEDITIKLTGLLHRSGFPKTTAKRAIKKWGNKAAEKISRDPFRLMQFPGIGWKLCDALYLDLGLQPDRLRRQMYCGWHAIRSSNDGNTWYPSSHVVKGIRQLASGNVRPVQAIKLGKRIGALSLTRVVGDAVIESNTGGAVWLAEGQKAANEMLLAERIVELMHHG